MDSRANVSRAILCAAAAVVFQSSTPDYDPPDDNDTMQEWQIDPTEMPRHVIETESAKRAASKKKKDLDITVDDAMQQARSIGERALDRALGAARRNDRRREFRLDIARGRVERTYAAFQREVEGKKAMVAPGHSLPLLIPNPFAMGADEPSRNGGTDSEGMDTDEEGHIHCWTEGPVRREGDDAEWTKKCLPRLLAVLRTGAGHAILHDGQWEDRFYRIGELLRNMAILPTSSTSDRPRGFPNYGPHLVITSSGPDFDSFAAAFGQLGHGLRVVRKDDTGKGTKAEDVVLRVLPYRGSKDRRRRLRKHFGSLCPSPDSPFCFLGGHADSPYHVILTSFSAFAEDYVHFCQIPFQAVILDDGMSWLGCAHSDPNSKLGKVWDTGLWSFSDHGAGMAGVSSGGSASWDFSQDDGGVEADKLSSKSSPNKRDITSNSQGEKPHPGKQLIGLTARHRILLASNMHATCNGHTYAAPILSMLSFLAPHFVDIVRDDWDRSKLSQCDRSKSFLRKLIARSVVVHSCRSNRSCGNDLFSLALRSLNGENCSSNSSSPDIDLCPESKETEGIKKSTLQRKDATAWFRPGSAMLKELNDASLDSILATVKSFNSVGFVCEEIVTASSLTTSGANGAVTGPAAYRTAVRCGRPFSNEQSLRQHIVAFHAPAGTWLCRSCGIDCVTSQARAHHERSCSVPDGGAHATLLSAVKTPAPLKDNRRGPKKKEVKNLAAAKVRNDNSSQVPGYKGVWIMPNGKYCVKIDGTAVSVDSQECAGNETPLLFDSAEAAAKKHDQILKESGKDDQSQMNYGPDGLRIIHEEETTALVAKDDSGVLEGATASSLIVPALAVINIKDLPKDVKPLLRDPNQTSRTGGNSKRYVYAYRGVCRQARKGHDRWQAQISFNGCNHYLGTFDSEWDAAAVYAWAHLILYGEEATKRAQQEGEEAAAAYEQLQKDIAEGKIPPPAPTPPKKKKNPPGAPKGSKGPRKRDKIEQPVACNAMTSKNEPIQQEKIKSDLPEKLVVSREEKRESKTTKMAELSSVPKPNAAERESTYTSMYSKKEVPQTLGEWNKLKTGCAMMLSSGTKGTSKANLLATKKNLAAMSNDSLLDNLSERLTTGSTSFLKSIILFGESFKSLPTCVPLSSFAPSSLPQTSALLIGLSAAKFSWDPEDFISTCRRSGASYGMECAARLAKEYGTAGTNASFRSLLLSSPCLIGRATKASQKNYRAVQIKYTLGMSVEGVGCNVAGPDYSCSEAAAKIELRSTQYSRYQFLACNDEDIVTLNGKRIQSSMGPFPLRNNDICSVGARVFVFIENYDAP